MPHSQPTASSTGADRPPERLGWIAKEPDFTAVLDHPTTTDVRSHTLQVARFAGWIASATSERATVRAFVGGRDWVEVSATEARPDVAAALATPTLRFIHGFDFYIDLPPGMAEPLRVNLVLSDGVSLARTPPLWLHPSVDIGLLDTHVAHAPALQTLARQMLAGRGLEFGALHLPLEVDPVRTQMSYADRHTKADALRLFDELRDGYGDALVAVDHIVDLNRDNLSLLEPSGFDFFVANGVIEHLVNPVRFLRNVHRIMRPGARFFLAAPDRDFTFDTRRALTPLEHLLEEYRMDVTTLSDAHVEDALSGVPPGRLPDDPAARAALIAHHRTRSVHAHVWDQRSFDALLDAARDALGLSWQIVAREPSRKALGNAVYVLEKR